MEFGVELDDDLFETSRNKESEKAIEYSPKVYNNEWFLHSGYNEAEEEHLTQLKSHADYLYYQHKYSDSIKKYLECLQILQSSNITLRRDCLEGVSRSYLHQEELTQALYYALELFDVACNINHKVVVQSLLASIYHQMDRYSDELNALHFCLQHHSWNYDFWLRLAFCYSGFFGIKLNSKIQHKLLHSSGSLAKRNQEISENNEKRAKEAILNCDSSGKSDKGLCFAPQENRKSELLVHDLDEREKNVNVIDSKHDTEDLPLIQRGTIIVCACLVRARLLLQTCILGYHSFAQESNIWQQEQIAVLLNSLEVEEDIVEYCTQVYLRDIGSEVIDCVEDKTVLEKLKEKAVGEEVESTENKSRKQFEAKWFGWLFTT